MSESDKQPTETVELTNYVFRTLLNLTGGDPELQPPRMRSFVAALHDVRLAAGLRWAVELTEQDIETMVDVLEAHFLTCPQDRTKFVNQLCKRSETFHRIVCEKIDKENKK